MVTDALNSLARLPAPVVLCAAAVLAFSETGIGFGFFIPGETGVLLMATTATSVPMFLLMSLVVWLSAAAGDSFGYMVGRRYGVRLRETRLVERVGRDKWDRTGEFLQKHGATAVIVSRFLPAVRVLTPATAGALRLHYPRFLVASLAGALVWGVGHVAIGAFAGASIKYIEQIIGTTGWVALGLVVLCAAAVMVHRRRRTAKSHRRPN